MDFADFYHDTNVGGLGGGGGGHGVRGEFFQCASACGMEGNR